MSAGVYGLFYEDQCLYIGQSVNVSKRLASHRSALKSKTHSRKDLLAWIADNSLAVDQINFVQLETIEKSDRNLPNLLEIKYFISHPPLFHGQSPSLKNDYTKLSNSPEVAKAMGRTLSRLAAQSYTGVCRFEDGRYVWGQKCLVCKTTFEANTPTSFYCSEDCKVTYKSFDKTCESCDTGFTARYEKTKFCNTCRYIVHDYDLKCIVCGSDFTSGRKDSKYCSQGCKVNSYKILKPCSSCGLEYSGFSNTRCKECRSANLWGCVCVDCGNDFQGSGPMTKFCSSSCGNSKTCASCGETFKTQSRRSTCSTNCSKALRSPTLSRVSKKEIEALISDGLSPRAIMERLEITKASYYRIRAS